MKDKLKRDFVSCGEEDRISNLPEQLIASILERLTIQDAVRTSIFSKKWRYRWTKRVALIFDEKFSQKFTKDGAFSHNEFIRIINQVLISHKGPILKFHLHIPKMFPDSYEEVDQWMLLLSRKNVKELIITNSNRRYELPSDVYSCLELTKLNLENCLFKLPLEFEKFLNLKELHLKNIDFGANLRGTPINLPQLKTLHLTMCTNVHNFNIEAKKLQMLVVNTTCPGTTLLQLLQNPCLTRLYICYWEPAKDNVRAERMTLATMLSNLPEIHCFLLDSHFFEVLIAENIPKWLPHPVNSLKHLLLHKFRVGDLHQLHGVLCLLRNSPNLAALSMLHLEMDPQVDVGPASDHLESPDCLDCTLNQLKIAQITYLEGSRPQLLFIKLLLAHSPSLEKLTITPSTSLDVEKRSDITKDVMQFPRASPKAEIVYLNPEEP